MDADIDGGISVRIFDGIIDQICKTLSKHDAVTLNYNRFRFKVSVDADTLGGEDTKRFFRSMMMSTKLTGCLFRTNNPSSSGLVQQHADGAIHFSKCVEELCSIMSRMPVLSKDVRVLKSVRLTVRLATGRFNSWAILLKNSFLNLTNFSVWKV